MCGLVSPFSYLPRPPEDSLAESCFSRPFGSDDVASINISTRLFLGQINLLISESIREFRHSLVGNLQMIHLRN